MLKFELGAPILVNYRFELVDALEKVVKRIREGQDIGYVPGEYQGMEWTVEKVEAGDD